MSTYEIIVSVIASTNLLVTLVLTLSNRNKAAAARVDNLGEELKKELAALDSRFDARLSDQARRIERLDVQAAHAPTHADLSDIYEQLNATRQQVERLGGEVEQMNANLRMVLSQLMKTL